MAHRVAFTRKQVWRRCLTSRRRKRAAAAAQAQAGESCGVWGANATAGAREAPPPARRSSDSLDSSSSSERRTVFRGRGREPTRAVSFDPRVRLVLIPRHTELDEDQHGSMWWTGEELNEFRRVFMAKLRNLAWLQRRGQMAQAEAEDDTDSDSEDGEEPISEWEDLDASPATPRNGDSGAAPARAVAVEVLAAATAAAAAAAHGGVDTLPPALARCVSMSEAPQLSPLWLPEGEEEEVVAAAQGSSAAAAAAAAAAGGASSKAPAQAAAATTAAAAAAAAVLRGRAYGVVVSGLVEHAATAQVCALASG